MIERYPVFVISESEHKQEEGGQAQATERQFG
jgi:hypothetical protein